MERNRRLGAIGLDIMDLGLSQELEKWAVAEALAEAHLWGKGL